MTVGKVGAPMAGMEIKLVDWKEGNYLVTDVPKPRGEIIIGGPTVAKGLLQNSFRKFNEFPYPRLL